MPRIARVVVEGVPHHVTQRGNGRRAIFRNTADYQLYRHLLREYAEEYGVTVWGYCLMPNHVHLVCVPDAPESLARAFGRIHAEYARFVNIRDGSCGHLWQARYYSCPLDARHRWLALAYVEQNPVRAGLIERPWEYRWSSAAAHVSGELLDPLVDLRPWEQHYNYARWTAVLQTSVREEAIAERLREATRRGRPLGSDEFIQEIEEKTGRRLRPQPPGRRPNAGKAAAAGIGNCGYCPGLYAGGGEEAAGELGGVYQALDPGQQTAHCLAG